MRYHQIDNKLFVENRKKLIGFLNQKSIAIFNSNDIMPTNADGTMGFKQNSDLFYLSGVDQEETILVINPSAKEEKFREILFLRETNEHIAIWEGEKLTKVKAREVSGINTVFWLSDFEVVLKNIIFDAEEIYLNSNEHIRNSSEVETRDNRFRKKIAEQYPLHAIKRIAPIMHDLRCVKSDLEVELMQIACNLTAKGVERVCNFLKPGVYEFEVEAEILHEFVRNRSKGFAYTPIIASGKNACVLHYIDNNQICKDGDLVLMDFGAEYANYASDLTRCFPVNGKFSDRQKQVYNAVLSVMKQATAMLVPGNNLVDYHTTVGKIMEEELIKIGLLEAEAVKNQNPDAPLYKKYFMHGTSHHLGLDVHDVGSKYKKFEAGMVFTCEPGIYIPEEGLGIRIENDILITNGKPKDLMAHIPITVEEIEEAMAKKSVSSL
jgi:Xaa-Pro aminopeptidase